MSCKPLRVVLGWHMHQPSYQDPVQRKIRLPWTYLHAIKDYSDMANHLRAQPEARAVINFSPVLLIQLKYYGEHLAQDPEGLEDPLLRALYTGGPSGGIKNNEEIFFIIRCCLRANSEHMIKRFPAFERLAGMAGKILKDPTLLTYVNRHYLTDLLMWYHLAWCGETIRLQEPRVQRLIRKEQGYSHADCRRMVSIIGKIIQDVIPAYRELEAQGKVELSFSPYSHAMLPLLINFNSARESMPDTPLPGSGSNYPGGEDRAMFQIREGIKCFTEFFGHAPLGCWPSEGGISEAALIMLGRFGLKWVASGQSVLQNSLANQNRGEYDVHKPYRYDKSGDMACFFRDEGLSDLIGFTYKDWHAEDALNNLISHLDEIAVARAEGDPGVVTIFLDGENAWEYYPANGYYFLSQLYERIAQHPRLRLTTFHECLEAGQMEINTLSRITAGSWIYGTFSTWVGHAEKNAAWNLLIEAKRAFDREIHYLKPEQQRMATRQLAICEGSDWFWWPGDNSAKHGKVFADLFRHQLMGLYHMLNLTSPAGLTPALDSDKMMESNGFEATTQEEVMHRGEPGS